MSYELRIASLDDAGPIAELIARSARTLGAKDYSPAQIEGALRGAFGLDTQLIEDGTYFVADHRGALVGCGGWSFRRTLFGSNARTDRDARRLDPATEAAKIRAFFVDPAYARQGIGRAILERCEGEASAAGFLRAELMATLPGVRLYSACGYVGSEPVEYPVGEGVSILFVPMSKQLPRRR